MRHTFAMPSQIQLRVKFGDGMANKIEFVFANQMIEFGLYRVSQKGVHVQ